MRDYVLLFINGVRHEIRGDAAFLPLSDYLRYHRRLTGTKIVCSEGDCGACAVLVGRPNAEEKRIDYRPITSCIAMVFQLDGSHVVTVEGLAKATRAVDQLHPAQRAMVSCNGAQCGFCTPGFVVSMAAICEKTAICGKATDDQLRLALTGNLCRCTGYEQILSAARAIDLGDVVPLNEAYPPLELIVAMQSAAATEVRIQAGDKVFYKPITISNACRFKKENPGCILIAGGTDIGVLINKGKIEPQVLLSVGGMHDASNIEETETHLVVGMRATLTDLERVTESALPELHRIMRRHGSPLIRNAGTLSGNIVNGSPIGDTMPALMVLDAQVEITGIAGSRLVSMNAFYTGYRKTVLGPDELLTRVLIPKPASHEVLHLFKVSKRWDLDISTFTAAFLLKLDSPVHSNGNGHGHSTPPVISEARVAYGGVAAVILRLPETEAFLRGQPLTEATMEQAGALARTEIMPISDVRSSADYRLQLAENMPLKLFHELTNRAPARE